MDFYYSQIIKWIGAWIFTSTLKVKVDEHDNFLSARFTVFVRIDIGSQVQTGDIPAWAIQQYTYDPYKSVTYYAPHKMDIRDIGAGHAVIKPHEPLFFQRYYDIGVPFEMVNMRHGTMFASDLQKHIIAVAKDKAYEYLDKNGYVENGEIARFEIKTWTNFPSLGY